MPLYKSPRQIALAGVLFVLTSFTTTRAADIVVNSTADPAGFDPGITVGTLGSTVTLRDAVNAANNTAGADTILFDASIVGQTITLVEVGVATQGDTALQVTSEITISEPSGTTTFTRSSSVASLRFFHVTGAGSLSLNGVKLIQGKAREGAAVYNEGTLVASGVDFLSNAAEVVITGPSSADFGNGGAVCNTVTGLFTATDSRFQQNTAGSLGGAIFNDNATPGAVSLSRCALSNNTAIGWQSALPNRVSGRGGAIYNRGSLSLMQCDVNGNNANGTPETASPGAGGGAIMNASPGDLVVTQCQFADNLALGTVLFGGAINNNGTAVITSSSFIENNAGSAGTGGAILAFNETEITNCTFSGNMASVGSALAVQGNQDVLANYCTIAGHTVGNSVVSLGPDATLRLSNSILYNPGRTEFDAQGTVALNIGNIIGSPNPQLLSLTSLWDLRIGPNLMGNPLQVYPLAAGSPAIDASSNTNTTLLDQRGYGRPVGNGFDIGAYEYGASEGLIRPATITSPDTATFFVGTDNQFTATVDSNPPASLLFSGTLPSGVTQTSPGVLQGIPTVNPSVTSYPLTLTATNGYHADTVQNFTLILAEQQSLVVDTTSDVVDSLDGQTSLREAVAYAATLADAQTITFAPELGGQTITLVGGQLELTKTGATNRTTISGPDSGITISGDQASRIFRVNASVLATLDGLTLADGLADSGGAVSNSGNLIVTNCLFRQNSANLESGSGGAISHGSGGTLDISNSVFQQNQAFLGGAINSSNSLTIADSTFSSNTVTFNGGALRLFGTSSITGSTFHDNEASNGGGGLINHGTTTVVNTTFTGNTALDGGGLQAWEQPLDLRQVTITGNTGARSGGGMAVNAGTTTLNNSIVAANTAVTHSPDISGTLLVASEHNLIGTGGSGGLVDGVDGNLVGVSPANLKFGPLADNGGPTQTIALLPGSLALDAGAVLVGITLDQRGASRSDGSPDIGAYEADQVPLFTLRSPSDLAVVNGEAASAMNETVFGDLITGRDSVSRTFTIVNTGYTVLTISDIATTGTNPESFSIVGGPTTLATGEVATFELQFAPQSVGNLEASFVFTHDGPDSPFTFHVAGVGKLFESSQASGPSAGGNTVTFTFAAFGTITDVLVDGVAAQIVENHGDSVSIIMPPGTSAGLVDITIQTSDNGDLTLPDAYSYNPQGRIGLRQPSVMAMGVRDRMLLKKDGTIYIWGAPNGISPTIQSSGAKYVAAVAGSMSQFYDNWRYLLRADGRVDSQRLLQDNPDALPHEDIVAIAAGNNHSLFLKSDGSIIATGRNVEGQATVPAPNADFVWIAAGGPAVTSSGQGLLTGHSLGVKSDGSIIGWGANEHGQTTVPTPNSDFVAVAAGELFSLGLKSDGSVVGWGDNAFGQTSVPAPNTGFVAISAGKNHSLGLKSDGSIVAWGRNVEGQTTVPSPNTDFVAITTAVDASWGLKPDGTLVAWGVLDQSTLLPPSPEDHKDIAMPGGVTSPKGSWTGGYEVVIAGTNLSSGEPGDIESVTLAGIPATVRSVSGGSHIVVLAGAAPNADLLGDVVVTSTSHGVTTKADAFTYLGDLPAWRALHGLASNGSQDLANPSGDGVENLLKYAFNTAPNAGTLIQPNLGILDPVAGTGGLPAIRTDHQGRLIITFVRRKTAGNSGIHYEVLTGDDLSDLQPLDISGAVVESIDTRWERVTATDPATTDRRFGLVRVAVGP